MANVVVAATADQPNVIKVTQIGRAHVWTPVT